MPDYTYLFGDLRAGGIAGELPLQGVRFGRRRNEAGAWSASLLLGDPRIRALDPAGLTRPGRTALYIDRDGVIVGGGIIWTRRYSDDGDDAGKLMLAGAGFWSYWRHRRIRSTLTFAAVDQATIVETIIDTLQAATGGDIGMAVDAPATGVLRDRTYYGYERKNAGEAIEQLAGVIDGFEFDVTAAWDGAAPVLTLEVGYPRLGQQAIDSPLVFERPGNLVGYDWPEDASRQATHADAIGEGEGDHMLIASSTRTDLIAAGWPLLEDDLMLRDVSDPDTLLEHAEEEADARGLPVTIPELTVRGDVDPIVGTYRPGDDCRVQISDDRFNEGLDTYARIIGFDVSPPEGDELETVTIALGEVEE